MHDFDLFWLKMMQNSSRLLSLLFLRLCCMCCVYRGRIFSRIWRAGVDSENRVGSGLPMVPKLLIFSPGVDFSSSRRHKPMLTLFRVSSGYTHCHPSRCQSRHWFRNRSRCWESTPKFKVDQKFRLSCITCVGGEGDRTGVPEPVMGDGEPTRE